MNRFERYFEFERQMRELRLISETVGKSFDEAMAKVKELAATTTMTLEEAFYAVKDDLQAPNNNDFERLAEVMDEFKKSFSCTTGINKLLNWLAKSRWRRFLFAIGIAGWLLMLIIIIMLEMGRL